MRIRYASLPVILSYLLAFSGCTDEVPPISPEEQYTRDFVKEFGVFKAESWSEARSGAVTVKTDRPTAVNVFAEINGRRFIFASLGSVNGTDNSLTDCSDAIFLISLGNGGVVSEPDWSKMLNTGQDDGHRGRAVSFCIPVAKEGTPAFDPLTPPQDLGDNNQTMRGFWVLVDKEDKLYHELLNLEFDPTPLEDEYVGDRLHRRLAETQHAFKPFSGSLGDGVYRVDAPIRKQWHNNDATADIGQGENGFYQHMLYDAETPNWKE